MVIEYVICVIVEFWFYFCFGYYYKFALLVSFVLVACWCFVWFLFVVLWFCWFVMSVLIFWFDCLLSGVGWWCLFWLFSGGNLFGLLIFFVGVYMIWFGFAIVILVWCSLFIAFWFAVCLCVLLSVLFCLWFVAFVFWVVEYCVDWRCLDWVV